MKWFPLLPALFLAGLAAAQPANPSCGQSSDLPGLLACARSAVSVLPADKQVRLTDELHDAALLVEHGKAGSLSKDAGVTDYGWEAAKALIAKGGADWLIATARSKEGPLRYGRAEALFAAGVRAAGFEQAEEPARALAGKADLALRLNSELLSLAHTADGFERGDLAHAAAKLAAYRCDLARFEEAMNMVMARDAIRYRFWRARITGDRSGLPEAIMTGANSDDTRHARQTLEGLTFLAELGDCAR